MSHTSIAVLGAGIQGSLAALALAGRGMTLDLIDAAPEPMTRASLWNEGKLHLGMVYANEPSLRTAKLMQVGSTWFLPILAQLAGVRPAAADFSEPFYYLVSRDSIVPAEELAQRYAKIEESFLSIQEAAGAGYCGRKPRRLFARAEPEPARLLFDCRHVAAAFTTAERSIDPAAVAGLVRDAIAANPNIRFIPSTRVEQIARNGAGFTLTMAGEAAGAVRYDKIVNATWESRIALDAPILGEPDRPWLHRYKLACFAHTVSGRSLPSATIVLGPFGDVVWYASGQCYLSWYPVGRILSTSALSPGDYDPPMPGNPVEVSLQRIIEGLSDPIPALADSALDTSRAAIGGGYIFAWGHGDVGLLSTDLHSRHDVGLSGGSDYVSIDTAKYCLAPLFALQLAQRLTGVHKGDACDAEKWVEAAQL